MKSMPLLLAATLLLSACATVPPPTPAPPPSVTYTSLGEARLAEDARIVQRYIGDYMKRNPGTRAENRRARMRGASGEELPVRALIDALPEGIELKDGGLRVAEGAPHALLGRVVLRSPRAFAMTREELIEELQRLTLEAGGNVVALSFLGGDQDTSPGAVGYVLRSEQPSGTGALPTRPGKLPLEI